MEPRTSPGLRAALVGVTVLALLAIVALASRGHLGGGGGGAGPSQGLVNYAFSIFLVAYFLAAPFAFYALLIQQKRERDLRKSRGRGGRWVINIAVFLAFLLLALGIDRLRHAHGRPPKPALAGGNPTSKLQKQKRAADRSPRFQWTVVFVAAALGAGGAAAFVLVRRRRRDEAPPGVAAELSQALDDAIDDVRAETDPRRAVIKAYARMETVLAAHGLPREPAEAPYEFLGRTLEQLRASGASVHRLTDLFERAKFSLHAIDETMRSDALEALAAVRDELRASPA